MRTTTTMQQQGCRQRACNAAVLTAITALLAMMATSAFADNGKGNQKSAKIYPPHEKAFGKTYSELATSWWDWAVNQPADMNPITDETGAFCHVGQNEDFGQGKKIFFLAGNFGGAEQTVRHCTIPKGKTLFFPILNQLWVVPEECDTGDCRQFANDGIDPASFLECLIDGVPVPDIYAYRAQSPPGGSPFHIRAGGLLESLAPDFYVPRGYLPGSVADGYWLLVKLGKGNHHEIEFRGKTGDPENPDFQLSVKYILTVAGGNGDRDDDEDDDRD